MKHTFDDGFVFGTATSAYQIEGGRTDGKGDSIWDEFAHRDGTIADGSTGDIACDHYRRFAEDVALMADLGADAYRFSIAWSRILPEGRGGVETRGLDFYDRLVDTLLDAEIEPWVTLYHWDLPLALQSQGGWADRATTDAFAEYAHVVADHFSDRVSHWITHNEPWVAAMLGHQQGVFAPGLRDWPTALRAGHHLLLSHGMAADALRAVDPSCRVGIALDCRPASPASDTDADIAATRHFDGFRNRWFFDPVFGKGYPSDIVETYGARGRLPDGLDFVLEGDMDVIARPLDFVGINYYTSIAVRSGADESEDTGVAPGAPATEGHTEMGWPVTPGAFTEFLVRVHEDYQPASIVITENGASYSDGPDGNGRVDDDRRIAYLDSHLDAVAQAIDLGAPVDGYFVWSLLDNFEWTQGYLQRFGLVWIEPETLERIPKASFYWLRDLSENQSGR